SYVVALFVAGGFVGGRRPGERLRARTKRRNSDLRADLPTVACVIAVKVDNNKSLMVALGEVVEEGSGPLVEDLDRALTLARAGYGEAKAFELVASEAAEPVANRLYSFLAAATSGGLDLAGALLQQANEARQQRREELERAAARRQVSMVLPNLVFMTPVLFAFLLAPLPRMLFGK
ncbi:MAG TPA: type II secretion system F family protein, partial [Acidimicrobiales bacterium]|nr:type II secretion system F family protein [Acidimicrobiales bacterium]